MPTPEQLVAAQVARLKERTGRDRDGWGAVPTASAIVEAVSRAAGLAPAWLRLAYERAG